jgi:hypothetical protein
MNANPALGLFTGLAVAESKGLTGGDATKVAMISAITPFPMGLVLASVLADRDAAVPAPIARPAIPSGTGTTTGAGTGTGTGTETGTGTTPAPGKPPAEDPAAVLSAEFAKLQAAAAQLALHESQARVDTELALLVEHIRRARAEINELNRAAVRVDHEAESKTAEGQAAEKREEEAERTKSSKPTASRGS